VRSLRYWSHKTLESNKSDIVLYLDRRTVFDHFLCVFQQGTSEYEVAAAKHTTKSVRAQEILVHFSMF
jgi:hypothetical protein